MADKMKRLSSLSASDNQKRLFTKKLKMTVRNVNRRNLSRRIESIITDRVKNNGSLLHSTASKMESAFKSRARYASVVSLDDSM
jgi:hypothetical protein